MGATGGSLLRKMVLFYGFSSDQPELAELTVDQTKTGVTWLKGITSNLTSQPLAAVPKSRACLNLS